MDWTDDPVEEAAARVVLLLAAVWLFMLCAPALGLGLLGWWPTLGGATAVFTLLRAAR